jgi:hypothetical protein
VTDSRQGHRARYLENWRKPPPPHVFSVYIYLTVTLAVASMGGGQYCSDRLPGAVCDRQQAGPQRYSRYLEEWRKPPPPFCVLQPKYLPVGNIGEDCQHEPLTLAEERMEWQYGAADGVPVWRLRQAGGGGRAGMNGMKVRRRRQAGGGGRAGTSGVSVQICGAHNCYIEIKLSNFI